MNEYLDLIKIYYNEKLLFLTNDKFKNCHDCENNKIFTETDKELILNCGGGKSTCSNKIRIILPKYKSNYDLDLLKENLDKTIRWDIISEYIKIDPDKIKENNNIKEQYNDELKSIKDLFNKYNNQNIKIINDNYNKILKLKKEINNILYELKLPEQLDENIKELSKKYIEKSEEINSLTREINNLNEDIEYYHLIEEPELHGTSFVSSKKSVKKVGKKEEPHKNSAKKPDKKPDKKEESIKITIGSNVEWMKGNKKYNGIVEKITDKSYKICCKPGKQSGDKGSTYMISKEIVSLI